MTRTRARVPALAFVPVPVHVVALALTLAAAACDPAPLPTPATVAGAPCRAARQSDVYTADGVNTRTGCMLVNLSLGSVSGAADLILPVSLVRSEGNAPTPDLYPNIYFGRGNWLNVDEYVTRETNEFETNQVFILHTPNGDTVYDYPISMPEAKLPGARPDTGTDDRLVPRRGQAWRTRPFDGTILEPITFGFRITYGNPHDSRTLRKEYGPVELVGRRHAYLLSELRRASIYGGPANSIRIHRDNYGGGGLPRVTFMSTLYDELNLTPLVIEGARARPDGQPGWAVIATSTMTHGWQSRVTAYALPSGDIERLVSSGRNAQENSLTTFTYDATMNAAQTTLRAISQQEGVLPPAPPAVGPPAPGDMRTVKRLEVTGRAAGNSPSWPYAITTLVDRTRTGADRTQLVTECDHGQRGHGFTLQTPNARYFTFNQPDGTAAAYEYADEASRGLLLRSIDPLGKEIWIDYNTARGGGAQTDPRPERVTAFEAKMINVQDRGSTDWLFFYLRYDIFSARTWGIPLIGKVGSPRADPRSSTDRMIAYRGLYQSYSDRYMNNRINVTFDVPRASAGPDGRTAWEYRGLDGFTYETWDEDGIMYWYRYVDTGDQNVETIDKYLMGVKQERTVRDRYGRTLRKTQYDGNQEYTLTYHLNAAGQTDWIEDSATGERFTVNAWNATRSTVTDAVLARNNMTVSSYRTGADDFGNPEGNGTITFGPVTVSLSTTRLAGGLLRSTSVTGPAGLSLASDLDYAMGDSVANSRRANGQIQTMTPRPMMAMGGCK
jgi:hypothetical protein